MENTVTLTHQLDPVDNDAEGLVGQLGAATCHDESVRVWQTGCLAQRLIRRSLTAREDKQSALRNVRHAIPSSREFIVGVTPNGAD